MSLCVLFVLYCVMLYGLCVCDVCVLCVCCMVVYMCLGVLFVIYCVAKYGVCFVLLLFVLTLNVSLRFVCVFFLCDVIWFVLGLGFVVVERVLWGSNMSVCFACGLLREVVFAVCVVSLVC